jgi:hypothetical protein
MTASAKNDTPRTDAIVHNGTCVDAVNKYREISRQLERELTAALAEAEALRKDAGRWQRFKTLVNPVHFCQYMCWHPKDAKLFADIDAAIDAARSTEGNK